MTRRTDESRGGPILFTNVNLFDGVNEALIANAYVVVTDNLITAVSTQPLAIAGGGGVTSIYDVRYLMAQDKTLRHA